MKTIVLMISLILCNLSFGQKAPKKYETAIIKTSSQCGDCKQRIEDGLNYTKGVKYAELNLEENTVTVKYQASKISLEGVKKALNAIGYDADELKAPEDAVKNLPACCQPGGMDIVTDVCSSLCVDSIVQVSKETNSYLVYVNYLAKDGFQINYPFVHSLLDSQGLPISDEKWDLTRYILEPGTSDFFPVTLLKPDLPEMKDILVRFVHDSGECYIKSCSIEQIKLNNNNK